MALCASRKEGIVNCVFSEGCDPDSVFQRTCLWRCTRALGRITRTLVLDARTATGVAIPVGEAGEEEGKAWPKRLASKKHAVTLWLGSEVLELLR